MKHAWMIGALGLAACWGTRGGGAPAAPPPEAGVETAESEAVVGKRLTPEQLARAQAFDNARTVGILGSEALAPRTPAGQNPTVGLTPDGAGGAGGADGADGADGAGGGAAAAPAAPKLDKDAIRTVVRAELSSIRLCYEQRLLADPSLQGTTMVSFEIGADGKVRSATGSGFDAKVDACVADVVKRMEFLAPASGAMRVNYPFSFRSAGG